MRTDAPWRLRYSKRAQRDALLVRRVGLNKKATELLEVLLNNPFQNPPPYEKLGGELKGMYSRRINVQHRLIYRVNKEERTVDVLSLWSHYE